MITRLRGLRIKKNLGAVVKHIHYFADSSGHEIDVIGYWAEGRPPEEYRFPVAKREAIGMVKQEIEMLKGTLRYLRRLRKDQVEILNMGEGPEED